MNPDEFAQTIKQKYPQYQHVDNLELAQKMVAKYPQYASKVNFQPVQQQETIGNPLFKAGDNEGLGQVAATTAANLPSSAFNFAKGAVQSVIDIPGNIEKIVTPNENPNAPKVNALDVIKELPGSAYKTLVPQFLQHIISGNLDEARKAVENDPIGQIAPFVLAAEGGAKLADRAGITTGASSALDGAISSTARTALKPVEATISKIGDTAGSLTKSAASHITGLDTGTITNIIEHPEAFSKILQDQVSRGGLAGEVKTAIDQRINDLSALGKGYEGIKNMDGQVQVPIDLVAKTLKEHGIELVDGKVKVGAESIPLSPGDVSALQHFVDTYGNEPVLSNNAFLNTRSALSNMSAYDAAKTNNIKVISRSLRSAYDAVGKEKIPGLRELDEAYAPETSFLKQVKKDYLNKDGTFKDGAVNKIANATGVGKENLLNRLENVMPGIKKRVQILKAVEDIERAKGIKVGNYGRIVVGGGGFLAGGIPGAIIAEIISSPTIAVPLLRGLGYTNAQLIPILQTLKALAGDPNAAALFTPGITPQEIQSSNTITKNNKISDSADTPNNSSPR